MIALTPLLTLLLAEITDAFSPGWLAPQSLTTMSWVGALLVVAGSLVTSLSGDDSSQQEPKGPV